MSDENKLSKVLQNATSIKNTSVQNKTEIFPTELLHKLADEGKTDELKSLVEIQQEYRHKERLNEIEFQRMQIQQKVALAEVEEKSLQNHKTRLENEEKAIQNEGLRKKIEAEIDYYPKEYNLRLLLIIFLIIFLATCLVLAGFYITIGAGAFILLILSVMSLTGLLLIILKDKTDKEIIRDLANSAIKSSEKVKK